MADGADIDHVAAVLLTGGRGSRLGGVEKGALRVDGRTLLDRALDALQGTPVVVVGEDGPWRTAHPHVAVAREEPAFAGPAAAVLAGLATLLREAPEAREVLLLAVDVPRLPEVVPMLLRAAQGPDGVVVVDDAGRDQWLLGRYRVEALREAGARLPHPADAALRTLVGGLDVARLRLPADLTQDVDTVADARRAGVALPGAQPNGIGPDEETA